MADMADKAAETGAAGGGAESVQTVIERKLRAYFCPEKLAVLNESGSHRGHSAHTGGVTEETGETHFRVKIVSAKFAGMSLPQRHRAVYRVLAEELEKTVHALALTAKIPAEEDF